MSRHKKIFPRWMIAAVPGCALMWGALSFAQNEADEDAFVDDPLAELAALGDSVAELDPEGGGSIRAKKAVDPELMARLKDRRNLEAKVDTVKAGGFPAVAVRIKVLKPAKEGAGKQAKRNETIVLVPDFKVMGGRVDMRDHNTRINAGSYYLRKGDKVVVRLREKRKGNVWSAAYIERKK